LRYGLRGPIKEAIRLHARSNVGSGEREPLSKIQRWTELVDSLVPRPNFVSIRRRGQPSRKRLFTCPSSRQRNQLEQRTVSEQIEIVRVDVLTVAKPIAALTRPRPGSSSLATPRS
jgi:hypothetical protein